MKRSHLTRKSCSFKFNFIIDVEILFLNIGAAFTRFQTLRLQKVFPEVLSDNLISYGEFLPWYKSLWD